MQIITKSEKETYNIAKKFAKTLKGGDVIGLIGDLGAGKTIFTKGLAAGLGIKQTVNSPTFVLMKIYPVKNHKSIKQICHIDAYRIINIQEASNIGIEEYLNNKNTLTIIEWADNIKNILPAGTINIKITNTGNNKRKIEY
jgi:tRNA threonylcarbamoyladenosine biosynthesis protein TsaE